MDPAEIDSDARERFLAKLDHVGECKVWKGAGKPYGKFRLGKKVNLAHRVAWRIEYGEWPPVGTTLHHNCGNTRCCNPKHLAPLSQHGNIKKKARVCSENHPLERRSKVQSGEVFCRAFFQSRFALHVRGASPERLSVDRASIYVSWIFIRRTSIEHHVELLHSNQQTAHARRLVLSMHDPDTPDIAETRAIQCLIHAVHKWEEFCAHAEAHFGAHGGSTYGSNFPETPSLALIAKYPDAALSWARRSHRIRRIAEHEHARRIYDPD